MQPSRAALRLARFWAGCLPLAAAAVAVHAAPVPDADDWSAGRANAVFVSPNGSDSADGHSPQTALQSLEAARDAVRNAGAVKRVVLLPGTYPRLHTLTLNARDDGEVWASQAGPDQAILDGGGLLDTAIAIEGTHHLRIEHLTITRVKRVGIRMNNTDHTVIAGLGIRQVDTNGWNQGGIVSLGNSIDDRIVGNVIETSGYAGILHANGDHERVQRLAIVDNRVFDTCRTTDDCGAIYVMDRSHGASGVLIQGNYIHDFGPMAGGRMNKAIYLDDEISSVTVSRNVVEGSGAYAIQIHGGDHNVIVNNLFDISEVNQLGLYQHDAPYTDFGMSDNHFTCNVIVSRGRWPAELWRKAVHPRDAALDVVSNLYHPPLSAPPPQTEQIGRSAATLSDDDVALRPGAIRLRRHPPVEGCQFNELDLGHAGQGEQP